MKKDDKITLVGINPSRHLAKTNLQNLMNVWEKSQYISSWNENECWLWLGNKNGNWYGQFKKFGQVIRLHKFDFGESAKWRTSKLCRKIINKKHYWSKKNE